MRTADEIIKDLKEIYQLDEMSMAWVDRQENVCVWVENPDGYNNRYFKYCNSAKYLASTKIAGIEKPQYVKNHTNQKNVEDWILNSVKKKQLINLLNKPSGSHKGLNRWQEIILTYNQDNYQIEPNEIIDGTINLTDFDSAIPLDFPMLDYTKLI